MNMKSVQESAGLLSFNVLAPAPDHSKLGVESLYAGGLIMAQDYLGIMKSEGLEDGSFENGLGEYWTTGITQPATVTTDYASSGTHSIRLFNETLPNLGSYIEYLLAEPIAATALHFNYLTFDYPIDSGHKVTVTFQSGETIEDVTCLPLTNGAWWVYELDLSCDMLVASIKIETFDETMGGDVKTYVDSVRLLTTQPKVASWSIGLESDLNPLGLLDIPHSDVNDWSVTASYAAHSEFMVQEAGYAQLVFDIDDGISDINVMVFSYGINVLNVTDDVILNWTVREGVNSLTLYVITNSSLGGPIEVSLQFRNGTGIPVTCLGQYTGLLGVTSESSSPRAFVLAEDLELGLANGFNVSLSEDTSTALVADIIPLNSSDTSNDFVSFFVADEFAIVATPVLECALLSNDTSLLAQLSIEVLTYDGHGIRVSSAWTNMTSEGWLSLDLQKLAFETIGGRGYGVFTHARNLTVTVIEPAADGIFLNSTAGIYINIGFRSRVATIHSLIPRKISTGDLISDFDIITQNYSTTTHAFQGDRALIVGPQQAPVTFDIDKILVENHRIRFVANATPTIILNLDLDGIQQNISMSSSGDSQWGALIYPQTLCMGWNLFDIDLGSLISNVLFENGVVFQNIILRNITLSSDSTTVIDALSLDTGFDISIGIEYWDRVLSWSSDT
ncbi:MAG: hypothetical protein ACTSR9_19410, partial [Candidatus Thorarchaeota archaeon]